MYKLTRDVMVLSSGLQKRAGAPVGKGEVPERVWNAWIAEGIVVESVPSLVAEEPEKELEEAPLPHGGASLETPVDKGVDKQLRELSDEELRQMGRKLKITSWHLMKREKLIQRIEEQS
jgi:hypothetical protein